MPVWMDKGVPAVDKGKDWGFELRNNVGSDLSTSKKVINLSPYYQQCACWFVSFNNQQSMKALIINCTLKHAPAFSNTGALAKKAEEQLKASGINNRDNPPG